MSRRSNRDAAAVIIDEVIALIEAEGYDAVQLREVARRAKVSLTTVYKLYPTRDALILAAIEEWMATNTYHPAPPAPDRETLRDGLIRLLRSVFEPWERHPRMLEAHYLARSAPGGQRLDNQGFAAILPSAADLLDDLDPDYVADVALVLTNMTHALIGRFVDGALASTEILPALERVIYRLTSDNAALAAPPEAAREHGAHRFVLRPSFISPYEPGREEPETE
ncbi:TetR family transcriptional regulator [Nocardia sp. NPDC003482]|uniref:TetR family transcriptional regulator n=1 Tax=Nocardia sp. NPDC004068 TaxID=3364303 RepID=UPI00369A2DD3